MAIVKDYEIERVEIDPRTADAFIRISLLIVDNGTVISASNHRVSVPVEVSLGVAASRVNAALSAAGYPTLAAADTTSLGAILTAARANKGKTGLPRNVAG
jgi:hypothetical protein